MMKDQNHHHHNNNDDVDEDNDDEANNRFSSPTRSIFPGLDSLLLEIQETMNATEREQRTRGQEQQEQQRGRQQQPSLTFPSSPSDSSARLTNVPYHSNLSMASQPPPARITQHPEPRPSLAFLRRPLPNPRPSPTQSDMQRAKTFQLLSPTPPRPLPSLPPSSPPGPTAPLNHYAAAPPVLPPRPSPLLTAGVSYTNMLHDHDSPLGAHSIPTRIGTRPIHFSSPEHSAPLPAVPDLSAPSVRPIDPADRELFLSGHSPLAPRPDATAHFDTPQHSPFHIVTTRPSSESNRAAPPAADHSSWAPRTRSNSSTSSAPLPGLSVDRTRRFLSHSTSSASSSSNPQGFRKLDLSAAATGSSRANHLVMDDQFDLAFLSQIAKFLRDNVPKGTKIKGAVEYPFAFTGREAVSTITHCLNRFTPSTKSTTQATLNRKLALTLSRKLLSESFFHEVNNLNHEIVLNDNIDEVYIFPSDEFSKAQDSDRVEPVISHEQRQKIAMPQTVLTNLTGCYSFSCRSAHATFSSRAKAESKRLGHVGSTITPLPGVCYSYDCPARPKRDSLALTRTTSLKANQLVAEAPAPVTVVQRTQDWASVVSKDLLSTLDSKEIARQSIIYEIISGEQEYLNDLDDFEKLFIIPLKSSNPPIIEPTRLPIFLEKVASNVLEIRDHNRVLLQNLIIRQQDQHPLVKGIGDIILNSALEWGQDYIRYTNDHVFGEVEVNDEVARNPLFKDFLNTIPKQSSRRADFKHYFLRASVRLQRYILLLDNLLRKTVDGHEDRNNIETAIEVIKRQCKDANLSVELQQAKLRLVRLHQEILWKADTPDLQLLSPNRQLFEMGKVTKKPEGGPGLTDSPELTVMLFDHYFLMTKIKRPDHSTIRYQTFRSPIMLELLRVSGFNDPPERKSRGLRTITGGAGSASHYTPVGGPSAGSSTSMSAGLALERGNSDPFTSSSTPHQVNTSTTTGSGGPGQEDKWLFPMTIHALGKAAYSVTLYVDSERARLNWKAKFEEAIGMRIQILDNFRVFDLNPMTDMTFAATGSVPMGAAGGAGSGGVVNGANLTGSSSGSSNHHQAAAGSAGTSGPIGTSGAGGDGNMHGPPTCSVPFKSTDGKLLIGIGCSDGLWIGLRNDPSSVRQVIHIRGITQIAVLQEFGFLLILAEKILLAYPLESLVPSRSKSNSTGNNSSAITMGNSTSATGGGGVGKKGGTGNVGAIASRLSGNKDVLFFKCGKVGPRTLVIYVKKGGVNQTVFKALEPVKNTENVRTTTSRGFFGLGGQKSESFRGYKEFFVPSESYAIQYLRSTLAIHCARGFEIMNLDTLKTASIPDFQSIRPQDPRLLSLQRRCDESRPLGMFRLGENEFLLCYDEFAFFADKHGDPLPERYSEILSWDSKPNSVAYSSPYLIIFSSTIIEIWNTLSAKRVQLIIGSGMSCTYDGGSLGDDGSSIVHVTSSFRNNSNNVEDEGERRIHLVIKDVDGYFRVFEMVPLKI